MWAATPTRALAWPARRATRDSSFRRRRAWVRAGQTRGDETRDASADASSSILRPRTKGKHLDRPWHLTYLRNSGHATKGTTAQRAALRELWPLYGVDIQTHGGAAGAAPPTLNLAGPDGVFGRVPPTPPSRSRSASGSATPSSRWRAPTPTATSWGARCTSPASARRS